MDKTPAKYGKDAKTSNNIRDPYVYETQSPASLSKTTSDSSIECESQRLRDSYERTSIKTPSGKSPARSNSEDCDFGLSDSLMDDTSDTSRKANVKPQSRKSVGIQELRSVKQITILECKDVAEVAKKPELLSIPQTNFAIGLLVMCCFNPPFGLLALYFSLRAAAAYRDGDKTKGAWCARTSIVISLLGIMVTMVIISSVVLYIAVSKHSAKREYKLKGGTSFGF